MESKKGRKPSIIIGAVCFVLDFLLVLLSLSMAWMTRTWQRLTMEELVYEMTAPLQGTGSDVLASFARDCLVPAIGIIAVLAVLTAVGYRKRIRILQRIALYALPAVFAIALVLFIQVARRLELGEYLANQSTSSDYVENHYVDPEDVEITFPEKKKNLVYIYLESMEATYTDFANGGGFEQNIIPELTELAQENECFAGDTGLLNGGYCTNGTTWTVAGMFAASAGLPLLTDISQNGMSSQAHFFPGVTALGDILEREGYTQELLIGSDATFGGRRGLYTDHGNYIIHDHPYAIGEGLLPPDYYVWWGYEDKKLFEFAKEDLLSMAEDDAPFCMVMLTVDTHITGGYTCELCRNEFPDNPEANIFACSSRQVEEFVRWIQQQDFYEDTVIVLSGDHISMDGSFCSGVDSAYNRRVYTSYIHPFCENASNEFRQYSTLDNFPTTLAAMGVSIEGNRLGLGTNLFSGEPTLLETDGKETVDAEFARKSPFISKLMAGNETILPDAPLDVSLKGYNRLTRNIKLEVLGMDKLDPGITDVTLGYINRSGKEKRKKIRRTRNGYTFTLNRLQLADDTTSITFYGKDAEGHSVTLNTVSGDLFMKRHDSLVSYVNCLRDYKDITILIGAKDEASSGITPEIQEALYSLGLTEELKDAFRCSYLAVIDNGEVLHEKVENARLSYGGSTKSGTAHYYVTSAGFDSGNDVQIQVNGIQYARQMRGLNMVVIDNATGEVLDSVVFDTCGL